MCCVVVCCRVFCFISSFFFLLSSLSYIQKLCLPFLQKRRLITDYDIYIFLNSRVHTRYIYLFGVLPISYFVPLIRHYCVFLGLRCNTEYGFGSFAQTISVLCSSERCRIRRSQSIPVAGFRICNSRKSVFSRLYVDGSANKFHLRRR